MGTLSRARARAVVCACAGKSTLIELITGENVLGFGQDLWLFGRKKGSGESVWDIRAQLGLVSTEMHME